MPRTVCEARGGTDRVRVGSVMDIGPSAQRARAPIVAATSYGGYPRRLRSAREMAARDPELEPSVPVASWLALGLLVAVLAGCGGKSGAGHADAPRRARTPAPRTDAAS